MPPHEKNFPKLWVDYFGPDFSDEAESDRLSWSVSDGRGDRKMVTTHFNDEGTVIDIDGTPVGTDFAVYAGGGDDRISAGRGNDRLYGEAGHDHLDGAGGDDLLYGDAGNDELYGGVGDDQLWGGSGNDTFIFHIRDDMDWVGRDVIHDFVAGEDKLHFFTVEYFHHTTSHSGNFANYAETSVAPGTGPAAIEAAANTLFAMSSWYDFVFVADGTDGYLFADADGTRSMIKLAGVGSVDGFSYDFIV